MVKLKNDDDDDSTLIFFRQRKIGQKIIIHSSMWKSTFFVFCFECHE